MQPFTGEHSFSVSGCFLMCFPVCSAKFKGGCFTDFLSLRQNQRFSGFPHKREPLESPADFYVWARVLCAVLLRWTKVPPRSVPRLFLRTYIYFKDKTFFQEPPKLSTYIYLKKPSFFKKNPQISTFINLKDTAFFPIRRRQRTNIKILLKRRNRSTTSKLPLVRELAKSLILTEEEKIGKAQPFKFSSSKREN